MTHPHLRIGDKSFKQRVLGIEMLKVCTSVLARIGCFYLASVSIADELCSIANAKHGNTPNKLAQVYLKSFLVVHRIRASAEDDTNNAGVVLRKLVIGHNLAEGVEFANTTADKLCGL